jgi:2-polyprenyl-3-methyl-5-hydroxy-6-metoxy-1,4-benzoquinol methylase
MDPLCAGMLGSLNASRKPAKLLPNQMNASSHEILKRREEAAERSGGISSQTIYSLIQRVIEEKNLRGSVLDYGAGRGQLTRQLLELHRFQRVVAADISPAPVDLEGVEWITQDLNSFLACDGSAFDVVIAAEVIEHLENPRGMIRELYRLLRPGGAAIITTPNNESWRSLLALFARGHFVAFSNSCYPAHITALLRKDFQRIFQESSFSTPEFFYTDEGGIPANPAITWQQASFGVLRGRRFSDNVLAVARKLE